MSTSETHFSSPNERWLTLGSAHHQSLVIKNHKMMSQSVFAINFVAGLLFAGAGMMYAGALISDYKIAVTGIALFVVALCSGHITITRFRDNTGKNLVKIAERERLLTPKGLHACMPYLVLTDRPCRYPKMLVKMGIVSTENYESLKRFRIAYKRTSIASPALERSWRLFQLALVQDLPHTGIVDRRLRRRSI